jgi:hypothetical protein
MSGVVAPREQDGSCSWVPLSPTPVIVKKRAGVAAVVGCYSAISMPRDSASDWRRLTPQSASFYKCNFSVREARRPAAFGRA